MDEVFRQARRKGVYADDSEDEELVRFNGPSVPSTDGKELENRRVTAAYRKKVDEEIIELKTSSGREMRVTREHPLLTPGGWEEAESLEEGNRLAVPRDIGGCLKNRELEVADGLEPVAGGGDQMLASYSFGRAKAVQLPTEVSTDLAEFMAMLIAEGHEQKTDETRFRIIFTNKNTDTLERFTELARDLFGLECNRMDESSVYADSRVLEEFLKHNGYETGRNSFCKDIPGFILSAPHDAAKQFLQTYFDCEGNTNGNQVELSTASEDLASSLCHMLARFSIVARISEKEKYAANTPEQRVRTYQEVRISGGDARRFHDKIGFSLDRKQTQLSNLPDTNTNVDTVPCGDIVEEARQAMGADRTQVWKHKQSLKAYEDGKNIPSRDRVGEIARKLQDQLDAVQKTRDELEKHPSTEQVEKLVDTSGVKWKELNDRAETSKSGRESTRLRKFRESPQELARPALSIFNSKHDLERAQELIDRLRELASSDLLWDEVENIKHQEYEGYVYDLTVEDNHSFVAGKGGIVCHNSYSMGTVIEEIQGNDLSDNLSTILIDPVGIYWSMDRPNDREAALLERWGMQPEGLNPHIYIPEGKTGQYDEDGIPFDRTFTLNPGRLSAQEWALAFDIELNSERGVLLERAITELTDERGKNYGLEDLAGKARSMDFRDETTEGVVNRLLDAQSWGVFGEESSLEEFTERGELSVVDVSAFGGMSGGYSVSALVVGLLAKRILRQRMRARKLEEINEMKRMDENEMPLVYMFIDEAHEFLPDDGETPASDPLMRWVKIGREPGVSLAMATQQPAKLHPDALSQMDILLSHRLTAQQDIEALGEIMQTYMRHDLKHYIDSLPDRPGTGLVLDDNSERIYPLQMRPRKSWHAGGTPDAFED
jgi:Intein/homing endonuclease